MNPATMPHLREHPDQPETVEVRNEVDDETLVFASEHDADTHALAVEEEDVDLADDLVLDRAMA